MFSRLYIAVINNREVPVIIEFFFTKANLSYVKLSLSSILLSNKLILVNNSIIVLVCSLCFSNVDKI